MKESESFSGSTHVDRIELAERELSAFIHSVTELLGAQEARQSAEDWLDELGRMDGPGRSTARDWRAVTIAAAARLANRIHAKNPRTQVACFGGSRECVAGSSTLS